MLKSADRLLGSAFKPASPTVAHQAADVQHPGNPADHYLFHAHRRPLWQVLHSKGLLCYSSRGNLLRSPMLNRPIGFWAARSSRPAQLWHIRPLMCSTQAIRPAQLSFHAHRRPLWQVLHSKGLLCHSSHGNLLRSPMLNRPIGFWAAREPASPTVFSRTPSAAVAGAAQQGPAVPQFSWQPSAQADT